MQRAGWRKWNAVLLALSAGLFALIGLGLAFVPLIYQKIPFLAEHPYAHSGWFTVCGILAFAGSLWTFVRALRRQAAVTDAQPMAVAILLAFLSLAPELPEANEYLGYGALCRAVPDGEKVYVLGIRRPENMDVYLGRDVYNLGDDIDSFLLLAPKEGTLILPMKAFGESEALGQYLENLDLEYCGPYAVCSLDPLGEKQARKHARKARRSR